MQSYRPENAVGRPVSDSLISDLLSKPDEMPELDHFAEMEMKLYRQNGVDIYVGKDGRVVSLFLYGVAMEDHAPYAGPLPEGLSFAATLDDVTRDLGPPSRTGRQKGANTPWIRYDRTQYALHLQFSPGGEHIERVTVMTPEMARGEV